MKKGIISLFALILLMGIGINNAFAKEFNDMDYTHWAYQQIQALAKNGVIVGYPDDSFKPDEPATRAEFATMVIKALRQEHAQPDGIFYFTDMPEHHWAYGNVQKACAYDLIKGFPDGTYKPEDNVSKAEAIAITISAIDTAELAEIQAKEALKIYKDADQIPDWAVIPAGKSEKLKLTAHNPMTYDLFEPDKKITRAEVAVNLYNMIEEAKVNPNKKLTPKKADGLVIDEATVDGSIATIPAGTVIPVELLNALNSQSNEMGEIFTAEIKQNLVTKEKYLLIPKGTIITGEIVTIKPGKYFIRNAKMQLDSKYVNLGYKKKSVFPGNVNLNQTRERGFKALVRWIIKGKKINLTKGSLIGVQLTESLDIDLINTVVLQYHNK